MSREDHNATELYLRWSAVLAAWMTCDATDRGAVKFLRAALPSQPAERYWNVTLAGKITGDPLGQYGMSSVCIYARTAEEAGRLALEQEKDTATELKIMFTRPA